MDTEPRLLLKFERSAKHNGDLVVVIAYGATKVILPRTAHVEDLDKAASKFGFVLPKVTRRKPSVDQTRLFDFLAATAYRHQANKLLTAGEFGSLPSAAGHDPDGILDRIAPVKTSRIDINASERGRNPIAILVGPKIPRTGPRSWDWLFGLPKHTTLEGLDEITDDILPSWFKHPGGSGDPGPSEAASTLPHISRPAEQAALVGALAGGRLAVVTGPPGVGKRTLVREVLAATRFAEVSCLGLTPDQAFHAIVSAATPQPLPASLTLRALLQVATPRPRNAPRFVVVAHDLVKASTEFATAAGEAVKRLNFELVVLTSHAPTAHVLSQRPLLLTGFSEAEARAFVTSFMSSEHVDEDVCAFMRAASLAGFFPACLPWLAQVSSSSGRKGLETFARGTPPPPSAPARLAGVVEILSAYAPGLLGALGVCAANTNVDALCAASGKAAEEVKRTVDALTEWHLLSRAADNVHILPVVRLTVRALCDVRAEERRHAAWLVERLPRSLRRNLDALKPYAQEVAAFISYAEASGFDAELAHVGCSFDIYWGDRVHLDSWKPCLHACLRAAQRNEMPAEEVHLMYAAALLAKTEGNYEEAYRVLRARLQLATKHEDFYALATTNEELAAVALQQGEDLREVRALLATALDQMQRACDAGSATLRNVAIVLVTCGNAELEDGQYQTGLDYFKRAEEHAKRAIEHARTAGTDPEISRARHGQGTAYFCMGQYDEALEAYRESYRLRVELKLERALPRSALRLAVTYAARGDDAAADNYFARGLEHAVASNEARQVAQYDHWYGLYLASRGRTEDARVHLEKARASFQKLGRLRLVGKVRRVLRLLDQGPLETPVTPSLF